MPEFTDSKSNRISYASPWLFAAAGLLLSLIISVFAVNNYRREKVVMGKVLVQEGQAVLNLTASAARAAIRDKIMQGNFDKAEWLELIQQVVEQGSEHPEIVALYMVDEKGQILVHSDQTMRFGDINSDTLNYLNDVITQLPVENSRILDESEDSEQLFQIASILHVFGFNNDKFFPNRENTRRHGSRMMREGPSQSEFDSFVQTISKKRFYLVANLDMTDYRASVQKQLVQIIILSLVLLLVGLAGFISMITLQGFKGSQLRLKRMSEFTDILVSSMPVGIIALNSEGLIQTCNQSAGKMLDLELQNIQGSDCRDIFPDKMLNYVTANTSRIHDGSIEFEIKIKDSNKVLTIEKVAVEDSKRNQRVTMLLIQDFTTQKKLQLELRRNERHTALGKMAAGVAHELRNPLSSIKGLAILLRNKRGQDRSSIEATDVMISEVERLDRSIGELLDYARPKNLNIIKIDLNDIIRKAVMLIESDAAGSGIDIIDNLDPEGCLLNGDQDRLTQVFLNLFLNSIQAMTEGGRLTVTTTTVNELVFVEIKDNGVGVDSEVMDKIFDPYFTTKNEGTGLGLSLSAKIVEDHLGTIEFASVIAQGTTVTVKLPV